MPKVTDGSDWATIEFLTTMFRSNWNTSLRAVSVEILCPILILRIAFPEHSTLLLETNYSKLFHETRCILEDDELSILDGLGAPEQTEHEVSSDRRGCREQDTAAGNHDRPIPQAEDDTTLHEIFANDEHGLERIQLEVNKIQAELELIQKVSRMKDPQSFYPEQDDAINGVEKEDEDRCLPDIPPNVVGLVIAPFLDDRVTFNNVMISCKEVCQICKTLRPPWPNKRLSVGIPLWSVAFSTDGNIVACGGGDGSIRVWHRRDGPRRRLRGHLGRVYSIVFSPTGETMASGSGDGGIRIWNTSDFSCIELERQTPHVDCLAFSIDGKTLASGGDGVIRLWNIETTQCVAAITEENRVVETVAFSPDGQTLASGNWGHTIHLWDLKSALHECVAILTETTCIHSISYSPDGKYMVSASDNPNVRLWDLNDQSYSVLTGHEDSVWSVAYSPDGKRIATGGDDGRVRVWNACNGQCTAVIDSHNDHSVYCVAFSSDKRTIASVSDGGYCQLSSYSNS